RQGAAPLSRGERGVLGAQPARPRRDPRPVTRTILLALLLAGCATRADLVQQDHELRSMVQAQRKQITQIQHEVERLRAGMEEGQGLRGGARGGAGPPALERPLADLEQGGGAGPPPPVEAPPAAPPTETPPAKAPAVATAPPPQPAKPPVAGEEDGWRKEIAR